MWQSEKPLSDLELGHNDHERGSMFKRIHIATAMILLPLSLILFVFTAVHYAMNTQLAHSNYTGIPAIPAVSENAKEPLIWCLHWDWMSTLLCVVRVLNLGLNSKFGFFLARAPCSEKHPCVSVFAYPAAIFCTLSAVMCLLAFIGIPLCLWLNETYHEDRSTYWLCTLFCCNGYYSLIIIELIVLLWVGVMGFVYVSSDINMNTLLAQEGVLHGVPYYLKVLFASVGRVLPALIAVLVAVLVIVLLGVFVIGGHEFFSCCFKWLTSGGKVPVV